MAPAMKAKGWGRILNFASLQTDTGFSERLGLWRVQRPAIGQLTRAMAEAWSGAWDHRECASAPGFFPTELTHSRL